MPEKIGQAPAASLGSCCKDSLAGELAHVACPLVHRASALLAGNAGLLRGELVPLAWAVRPPSEASCRCRSRDSVANPRSFGALRQRDVTTVPAAFSSSQRSPPCARTPSKHSHSS